MIDSDEIQTVYLPFLGNHIEEIWRVIFYMITLLPLAGGWMLGLLTKYLASKRSTAEGETR